MAKPNRWTFTVEGVGHFPLDMLRYDACWPRDSESVDALTWYPLTNGTPQEKRERRERPRRVTLTSAVRSPTGGRWQSFGWPIVNGSVREYRA